MERVTRASSGHRNRNAKEANKFCQQIFRSLNRFWHLWTNFDNFQQILISLNKFRHLWTNFDILNKFLTSLTPLNKFWHIWTNFDILSKFWYLSTNFDTFEQISTDLKKCWPLCHTYKLVWKIMLYFFGKLNYFLKKLFKDKI